MIIRVHTPAGTGSRSSVELVEADRFDQFHVEHTGDDTEALREVLTAAGAGRLDADGEARIRIDWLRVAAGPLARDETWASGFDGMLGYARAKGWLDDDDTTVRAHLA